MKPKPVNTRPIRVFKRSKDSAHLAMMIKTSISNDQRQRHFEALSCHAKPIGRRIIRQRRKFQAQT